MRATADWIDGRVMIPDLLRAAPQARPVLDHYGLRGCGGPLGPVETLEFFARSHDVPLTTLLAELREASADSARSTAPVPVLADSIYRPFFKSAIAVVLTLGAAWGAYLLLRIGMMRSFGTAGLHEVNAHGHAQIFGWVGLFVMGFAYQAFPRFKHTSLEYPRLALATLWLMLAGIVVRSVGEPMAVVLPWTGLAAVGAALLELAAAGLFVGVIGATWRKSGKRLEFYDYYILSSLVWFVVQAAGEAAYLAATLAPSSRDELLTLVATWQPALRDVQIHGFALLMVLGVSQRVLPHFYGFPAPNRRLSLALLACLNVAVVGEAAGLVLMRQAGHAWAGLWYGSVLLLAGTVLLLVRNWGVLGRGGEPDRSLKFLRAAYSWLLVSLAMLVLLPVYQRSLLPWLAPESEAARLGFSHAYYGAVRHAITVGFLSLMIVGVAARVVPTLNGVDVHSLRRLWGPFLLINTGCTLRVVAQTLTDFTLQAFPVAGVSGLLEVLGLALWGVHLWSLMARRLPGETARADAPAPRLSGAPVEAGDRVGDVLDCHPELLQTFLSLGFRPLASSVLRRTIARRVTVEQACRLLGLEVAPVLAALNRARHASAGTLKQPDEKFSLPMSSAN
jgi:hypothetical protein